MYIVKINNKFIQEGNPYSSVDKGLSLVCDFTKATSYHNVYEFLLSLKYTSPGSKSNFPIIHGKYIPPTPTFTLIDTSTLEQTEYRFDMTVDYNKEFQVDKKTFEALKKCFYGSSNWTYIDDNWVAFPNEEEYRQINKIRYYARGLIDIFENVFHYRNHSVPSCYRFYESRMFLLKNEELVKIALNDLDQCEEFNISLRLFHYNYSIN